MRALAVAFVLALLAGCGIQHEGPPPRFAEAPPEAPPEATPEAPPEADRAQAPTDGGPAAPEDPQ